MKSGDGFESNDAIACPDFGEPELARLLRGGRPRVLFGISFDGIAISGIVQEFIKAAAVFRAHGHEVHFDLGYDIKADKGGFFRDCTSEAAQLPDWLQLARFAGLEKVPGYSESLVQGLLERLAAAEENCDGLLPICPGMVRAIAESIIATWRRLDVSAVLVENGSLPENVVFTQALRLAIARYGRERRLKKFVLWRDHDLMWYCESAKYGRPPYRLVPKPPASPYIHYVTLTDTAAEALTQWAGVNVDTLPNCFHFAWPRHRNHAVVFRRDFGIPDDAWLIARCTRVIPQKRIDRDLHLLQAMQAILAARGIGRPIYLFISGSIAERPDEYRHLRELSKHLGVDDRVIYGNGLLSCDGSECPAASTSYAHPRYSVSDLLNAADISSFLTSYDYEGFGNPPAEACAHLRPFITTTYEMYPAVYGEKGFKALALPIRRDRDGLAPLDFAAATADLLIDATRRRRMAEFNFELGRRHFSMEVLESRLRAFLPDAFGNELDEAHGRRWKRQLQA